jgi:single-strand DNA-binding protein
MTSINTFTIVGNVAKDVFLRTTQGGKSMVTFVVAVDATYVDADGVVHKACDFIPVTTFGKQAENDAKYLKKGTAVAVSGRIRSWYKPEEQKGGFNFEATGVLYMGKKSADKAINDSLPSDNTPPNADHENWVQHYDAAAESEAASKPVVPRKKK